MGARFYEPAIGRFLSPDSIIPQPKNPQSLNRFSYALGNPLIYRDPSGHSPAWLDWVTGAFTQYVDDVSLGLFSALAGDLDDIDNQAYQEGRKAGRVVSTAQAGVETVQGVGTIATGLGASAPTLAAAGACTAATGGACAIPAGVVLGAEGTAILGGAVEAVHGGLMFAKIANDPIHHISTNKNYKRDPQWSSRFEKLFEKGGLSLGDATNKVPLPGHQQLAPHSQGYHQWVYDRLSGAIEGLTSQEEIGAALRAELDAIANDLLNNPDLLRMP